jgi:hypothetical protein
MPIRTHKIASLRDEALNLQVNHVISILCTQDGFSFTVYDKERNKFLALEAFRFEYQHQNMNKKVVDNHILTLLKALVDESESMTSFSRKKGSLVVEPNQATWIPLPLFNEQEKEHYIALNFKEIQGDVFFEVNHHIEAVCVYTVHAPFLHGMKQLFPNAEIHPLQTVLSSHFQQFTKKHIEQSALFCFVTGTHLYIQVFQQNALIFDNKFSHPTKQDFSYYVLNVYDKLSLNPETVPMFFTGDLSSTSETAQFLQKYIRHVAPLPANAAFSYSYLFDNVEMQRFYHIFNAVPCVLLEEIGKAGE